jgi:hypothetical protein
MPAFIRIEKAETMKKYERGWNYVETRHGRLVMVRNKKDGFDLHCGGWIKTKPRERVVREMYVVEPETEPVHCERPVDRRGGKVFIDVKTPRHHRRRSSSSDESPPPTPRARIQVRRPINAPPSPTYETYEPRHIRPQYRYIDLADGRLVQKVPVERARLQRVRPDQIVEEGTYCDEDEYDYEEFFDTADVMPTREARPYPIPEPENSFWDDELQAWMVSRKPRVRFE